MVMAERLNEEINEMTLEMETADDTVIFSEEAYRQYLRFLSSVADKLIKEDIRERTHIDDAELALISLLSALIQNKDMRNYLPDFTQFLERFRDEYLHLSISRRRKSRAEIIEAVKSAFRVIEEKSHKSFLEKLLRE
jgi:protein involved in sex pheromone biosynthesis